MFFNSQGVCLLLLLASFAGAQNTGPECVDECSADVEKWCHTKCYYEPNTKDLIGVCSQENDDKDSCKCDEGITKPDSGIAEESYCQQSCAAHDSATPCTAYRYIKPEVGDKFKCELLSACKSRDELTEIQADAQDHTDGGGRKCENPVDPVTCPTLEFQSGLNIVRWICTNTDPNTNPVETDPYYYRQPVGTECEPSHICNDPDLKSELAKCIEDTTNTGTGIWVNGNNDQLALTPDLGPCKCPELRIPAAQGTNLACTKEPGKDENGDFILGEDGNECALFCDNYFVADLTCEFPKDSGKEGTTWVASWDGNRNEVETCLSCWEGGCDKLLKI